MFRFLLIFFTSLLLAGCKASLYEDLNKNLPVISDWRTYENLDLGIAFKYPSYFGEPNTQLVTGDTGNAFLVRFVYGDDQDDPYIFYVAVQNFAQHSKFAAATLGL